jgi:formate/nitrite transporter FocA (FNT family)
MPGKWEGYVMALRVVGTLVAVVILALGGIVIARRAARAEGRDRRLLTLAACLNFAAGLLIVVFEIYDELVLFPC